MASHDHLIIGKQAENAACQFLQSKGLKLLEQNFHSRHGEIDLIMLDRDDIVFVEVRYRHRIDYGTALESVNHRKMNKLIRTATFFLQSKEWLYNLTSRFDIVAIQPLNGKIHFDWIRNAFSVNI